MLTIAHQLLYILNILMTRLVGVLPSCKISDYIPINIELSGNQQTNLYDIL